MPFLAYLAALLIAAASGVFGLDLLTAPLPSEPNARVARQATTKPVRQIPIWRSTARDNGDPNGALSPIYPTNLGGALKDVAAANTPLPVAQTTPPTVQSAAQWTVSQPQGAPPNASTAFAQNSCNIAACANAYRSFRESDCTYQPYVGPRQYCDKDSGTEGYAVSDTRIESAIQHTAGASAFASVPTRTQVKPFTAVERAAFERAGGGSY